MRLKRFVGSSKAAGFFAQMGAASALTLVRGFVLALLLSQAGFGQYALVVAAGTFGAILLSFGMTERTIKRFPRMYADGHADAVLKEADVIARRLTIRAVVMLAVVFGVAALIPRFDIVAVGAGATVVALASAWQSIYASVHRASGELSSLANANLARTIAALVLASIGAWTWSWHGAIAGEIAGAIIGAGASRYYAVGIKSVVTPSAEPIAAPSRELWTFASFLVIAVPIYLDRATVAALYGAADAGTYGFLALFSAAGAALATIIPQKVGPELIKLQKRGEPLAAQLSLAVLWAGVSALLLLALVAGGAFAMLVWPLAFLGTKFALDISLMAAIAILCAAQIGTLFDWVLLANDRERHVFAASALYVTALATGILVVWLGGGTLHAFVWTMATGKLGHVGLQLIFIGLGGHCRSAAVR